MKLNMMIGRSHLLQEWADPTDKSSWLSLSSINQRRTMPPGSFTDKTVSKRGAIGMAIYLVLVTIVLFAGLYLSWPECEPTSSGTPNNSNTTANANRNLAENGNANLASNENVSRNTNLNANRATNSKTNGPTNLDDKMAAQGSSNPSPKEIGNQNQAQR